jgi:hypothetical protein
VTPWFDVREALPGLRGRFVHLLAPERERELHAALEKGAFVVLSLEGRGVEDEAAFLAQAARALRLPPHFGHSWDALDEGLRGLGEGRSRRLALLWRDVDRVLAKDPQLVLDATSLLADVARELGGEDPPTQLEVFLLAAPRAVRGRPSRPKRR